MSNFLKDKNKGDEAEKLLIDKLQSLGFVVEFNKSKKKEDLSYWDLKIKIEGREILFEVKNDLKSSKTNNIAIEYFNCKSQKMSGIFITKATHWVYVLNETEIWLANVNELKGFLDKVKPFRMVDVAGDRNASLFLYKKESILGVVFHQINDMTTQTLMELLLV